MSGLAARLPLIISDTHGPYDLLQSIKGVAAQNLKMVVFTNPGERIMDASFGVGIRRYLFRQNVRESHDEIRSRIIQQVNKYLPYIKILLIDIGSPLDNENIPDNFVTIRLEYKIEPYNLREVLELPISV
mgnify:CR=1 FL=1|tara:strand:+ start:711 stop:1100 length:390 start_codon:yes stop_codon:yes gene_type:complete